MAYWVRFGTMMSWFLITMAMWAIDISVTAMNAGLILTNGLWEIDPFILYHLALWVIPVAFLAQVRILKR